MLVLGIESASDQCGCALASGDGVVAEARLALPRRHAEALAPQMRFVCEQAGVALGDIDAVAVDHGPGLYTGLRAGLATAKATAAALGIGVVPVDSLEALAFAAAATAQPGETVLSVLDARRGEVFWAWYRVAPGPPGDPAAESPAAESPAAESPAAESPAAEAPAGDPSGRSTAPRVRLVRLSEPQVGPPADLLPALTSPHEQAGGRTVVVGDGALRYLGLLVAGGLAPGGLAAGGLASGDLASGGLASGRVVIAGAGLRFPSPAAVALLGRERALAGEAVPPEQVDALYLRPPDARPQQAPRAANPAQTGPG